MSVKLELSLSEAGIEIDDVRKQNSKENVCLGEMKVMYIVTGDTSDLKGYCHVVCHVSAAIIRVRL
jgi:hypothetical protein